MKIYNFSFDEILQKDGPRQGQGGWVALGILWWDMMVTPLGVQKQKKENRDYPRNICYQEGGHLDISKVRDEGGTGTRKSKIFARVLGYMVVPFMKVGNEGEPDTGVFLGLWIQATGCTAKHTAGDDKGARVQQKASQHS